MPHAGSQIPIALGTTAPGFRTIGLFIGNKDCFWMILPQSLIRLPKQPDLIKKMMYYLTKFLNIFQTLIMLT